MESLNALVVVINAAMEHVPQHTRMVLLREAQAHIQTLEKALTPPEPHKTDQAA